MQNRPEVLLLHGFPGLEMSGKPSYGRICGYKEVKRSVILGC